jgi:hypothetical protein
MEGNALLQGVSRLIEMREEVQVFVPTDTGLFSLSEELIQGVENLLTEASQLMAEVTDHYDQLVPEEGEDEENFLTPQSDEIRIASQISAIAFVARSQTLETQEDLQRATETGNPWKVGALADTGVQRAMRGLIALEEVMCEFAGMPSKDRHWKDMDDALEIRRLYAQFRRAILRDGTPDPAELPARLRKVTHRINILRDLKIYPFLRIDDRLEIRRMQKRIHALLERDNDAERKIDGRHLWQDLESFAQLLRQVNLREELILHDRRVVAEVSSALFRGDRSSKKVPAAVRKRLESLQGKDDTLDEMLLRAEELDPIELKPILDRLNNAMVNSYQG